MGPETARPGRFERHVAALGLYLDRWPLEALTVERFSEFLRRRPDAFERSCREGHVTASAWVISDDGSRVLLVRHRKLGKWLQPGGHADGERDTLMVAVREAREESGLQTLRPHPVAASSVPFDIDLHRIPARRQEPAHLHYDFRHLLRADATEVPVSSDESDEVRWIPGAELGAYTREESVRRLARKAAALVAACRV